jgi:hypothetical protein
MNKFGRKFQLTVDMNDGSGQIIIPWPFTIEFTITRNVAPAANTMSLRIYNLSLAHRNRIRQDRFSLKNPPNKVNLDAGYDSLFTVFHGNIMQADSNREGVDIVTTIVGMDGGFDIANTQSNFSWPAGIKLEDAIKNACGTFVDIDIGAIGQLNGQQFNRPLIVDDNTYNWLKTYYPNVYIDKQKAFFLGNDEVLIGQLPVIDSSTGLLETPRREGAYLTIRTIFEPRITVGQLISLKSTVEPTYNGQYKVVGVNHQGIISGAVGGNLESSFSLLLGSNPFGPWTQVAPEQTTKST